MSDIGDCLNQELWSDFLTGKVDLEEVMDLRKNQELISRHDSISKKSGDTFS